MAVTNVKTVTVVIPTGADAPSNEEIDMRSFVSMIVVFPAGWVTSDLVIQSSDSSLPGGTYGDLKDEGGFLVQIPTAAASERRLAPADIRDTGFVKLKSVTTQGANRTLTLILKQ